MSTTCHSPVVALCLAGWLFYKNVTLVPLLALLAALRWNNMESLSFLFRLVNLERGPTVSPGTDVGRGFRVSDSGACHLTCPLKLIQRLYFTLATPIWWSECDLLLCIILNVFSAIIKLHMDTQSAALGGASSIYKYIYAFTDGSLFTKKQFDLNGNKSWMLDHESISMLTVVRCLSEAERN